MVNSQYRTLLEPYSQGDSTAPIKTISPLEHNQSHNPFLRWLPPELTSKIFSLCTYSYNHTEEELLGKCLANIEGELPALHEGHIRVNFPEPFRLSSICHGTREIAISTPQLWTHLKVDFKRCGTTANKAIQSIEILDALLSRTGGLPLTLVLIGENTTSREISYEPLLFELARHSSRWETLIFSFTSQFISSFEKLENVTPVSLRNLFVRKRNTFSPEDNTPTNLFKNSARPNPERVCVSRFEVSSLNVNWSNVRIAHVYPMDTPIGVLLLLREAPQLEELHVVPLKDYFRYRRPNDTPTRYPKVIHKRLQRFSLTWDTDIAGNLIRALVLPALTSLTVEPKHRGLDFGDLIADLVQRSGCTLENIVLQGSLSPGLHPSSFLALPSLQRVTIRHPEDIEYVSMLLQCLIDGELALERMVLPNLRHISLDISLPGEMPWELITKVFAASQRCSSGRSLESVIIRIVKPSPRFLDCFDSYGSRRAVFSSLGLKDTDYIPKHFIPRLLGCVESGFTLEVWNEWSGRDFIQESQEYHNAAKNAEV